MALPLCPRTGFYVWSVGVGRRSPTDMPRTHMGNEGQAGTRGVGWQGTHRPILLGQPELWPPGMDVPPPAHPARSWPAPLTSKDPCGEVQLDDTLAEGGGHHAQGCQEATHQHDWPAAEAVHTHAAERACGDRLSGGVQPLRAPQADTPSSADTGSTRCPECGHGQPPDGAQFTPRGACVCHPHMRGPDPVLGDSTAVWTGPTDPGEMAPHLSRTAWPAGWRRSRLCRCSQSQTHA